MKNLIIVLALIVLYSCSSKNGDKELNNSITILQGISETVTADNIFDDFEYISLETSEQSIFGSIDKLILYKDKFFILDKSILKKIIVFSKTGKFIKTIGNIGKGPGEYTNVEDFTIDEETGNIIILYYPSTVITYDYKGKFINQRRLSSTALLWNICSYKDGFICSSNHQSVVKGDDAFLIFNFDKGFNLLQKTLNPLPAQVGMPPVIHNPLLNIGDDVAYFDLFTSSLHINVNSSEAKTVKFDFEGKEMPLDYYVSPQKFFSVNQRKFCFFIDDIIMDNILMATFSNQGNQCLLTFNYKTNKTASYKISKWFPDFLFYKDKTIYTHFSASRILKGHTFFNAVNTTSYPIESGCNPIILTFKLKKKKT